MAKHWRKIGVALYCLVIWLVADLVYTRFLFVPDANLRTADPQFHHALLPNASGTMTWGRTRYSVYTNSLGFRDAAVREVPLKPTGRRIILIGDSFTEGIGVPFESSFAGLLVQAGHDRPQPIEFLDAGVASYSPLIYFKRIRDLIERGLQFDEVVVLPDISDVRDEAADYFCIDDDPRYRAYCRPTAALPAVRGWSGVLQTHLVMSDRLRSLIGYAIKSALGVYRRRALFRHEVSGWTIPGFDVGHAYAPLGVEGGIARAKEHMQALADLLAARGIPLVVAVYPWPMQLANNDRDSRQVAIWREFCARNCRDFIDAFPAFFAVKDADEGWYERLYIPGDVHFSAAGNRLMADVLAKRLLGALSSDDAAATGRTR
jgi:hypothetical protein